MKNIFVFCVMISTFFITGNSYAKGNCVLTTCGLSGNIGVNKEFIRAIKDDTSSQCYSCDSDDYNDSNEECSYDDIVAQKDQSGRIVDIYRCVDVAGPIDQWQLYNPGEMCENSDTTNKKTENASLYYLDESTPTADGASGGDHVIHLSGSDACWYTLCNDGYTPHPDKTKCVEIKPLADCTNTGGIWNFDTNKCICDSEKNLKKNPNAETCICTNSTDYEFDANSGQCKKKKSVIDEENRQRQNEETRRRQNQQRKTACENSGGEWKNNQCNCDPEKNLLTKNNVCVCLDDTNYRRQGRECILTDAAALQRECDSDTSRASGAYWDADSKQCLCKNPQHVWRGGECEMNPAITQCMQITGANWNNTTKKCYCIQKGYEINVAGTACEQTEESRREQQDAEREQAAAASRRRIEGAISDIESIVSTLDRSKWKNAEGGFNTSRLLSDSIAGVVLGTAGGLITSHVVKKNQVEGGFEDIQCTVGGQVVSGWGDEFQVGIQ